MSLLATKGLSKRYGAVVALRSADLVVEPGEIHALLGANGAGKSTLVKLLTGVIRPDAGTIRVGDREVRVSSPRAARRLGLAPVVPGSCARPRPHRRPQPAPDGRRCRPRAQLARAHGARTHRYGRARRRPSPGHAAHARSRARALARAAAPASRRDHRRPSLRPGRARVRRHPAVEGAGPLGAVHHPPAGGGHRRVRPRHRPPRRPRRRHADPDRRGRGADRGVHARPSGPRGDRGPGRGRGSARERRRAGRRSRCCAAGGRPRSPAPRADPRGGRALGGRHGA